MYFPFYFQAAKIQKNVHLSNNHAEMICRLQAGREPPFPRLLSYWLSGGYKPICKTGLFGL